MKLNKLRYFFLLILFSSATFAQDSLQHSAFSFSGYVDAYAATYSDSLAVGDYQKFATVSPRSNQFGLNVAMLTAKYSSEKVRGIFTLHYGDIPRSSWATNYNIIQEANVGIRLCKKLWIDAGFFRTHLGTEACFPKENYTSSLAITTYYEPLYEAGFRLNYNPTEKLSLYLYALNGYNIYDDNNRKKSAGLLATYVFGDKLNIGYSGYYGDDAPEGSSSHFRIFNNVFLNFKAEKLKITFGGDFTSQQNADLKDTVKSATAYGALLIVSYNIGAKFRVFARGEMFNDANGFLSGTFNNTDNETTGLKTVGATLGIEFKPTSNSYIRLEGGDVTANSKQEIFHENNKASNTNSRINAMVNIGFWFE